MTSPQSCSLAKLHVPGQPTPDQHHLLPRAFQAFWQPPSAQGKPLWDPRTITVCPNHHRLIHEAIVAMMHAGKGSEEPAFAFKQAFGSFRTTRVRQAAYLALTRWVEAGGSLEALRAAGEFGAQ